MRRASLRLGQDAPRPISAHTNFRGRKYFGVTPQLKHRHSHDESIQEEILFKVDVEVTRRALLEQEDTDGDGRITIEDKGPKVFRLGTSNSDNHHTVEIRGTYQLSNLLQELALSANQGLNVATIKWSSICEDPVTRIDRRIRDMFWKNLSRTLDASSIDIAAREPKDSLDSARLRIYIPSSLVEQYNYYEKVARERPELKLDVFLLPSGKPNPQFVKGLNNKPGILALDMRKKNRTLHGLKFVVPGGRFNELYNWDSYFSALGLMETGHADLARDIALNFCFEIEHYGSILNANRSYYLCRSQPPFLTDLALRVYENIKDQPDAKEFLRVVTVAAIREYDNVWMCEPRYHPDTGLSRYRPDGAGMPPEVEPHHFDHILRPYAESHGMSLPDFAEAYQDGKIDEPALHEFFLHDRAVRESGHDTSYRLEGVCADTATVDLNCLLYKYEKDIGWIIHNVFDDYLEIPWNAAHAEASEYFLDDDPLQHTAKEWIRRAALRKERIDKYLWNEEKGMYFDYNTATGRQSTYECATTFYALWSGVASPSQAHSLVTRALPKFEMPGGIVSGTERSKGPLTADQPARQWDHPYGWAPHQIMTWNGLRSYGYEADARRLAYKWLFMITKVVCDFNGAITEKYDVTQLKESYKASAEYGNQGLQFKGIATTGFGWTNASFTHGLKLLTPHMRKALALLAPVESLNLEILRSGRL